MDVAIANRTGRPMGYVAALLFRPAGGGGSE